MQNNQLGKGWGGIVTGFLVIVIGYILILVVVDLEIVDEDIFSSPFIPSQSTQEFKEEATVLLEKYTKEHKVLAKRYYALIKDKKYKKLYETYQNTAGWKPTLEKRLLNNISDSTYALKLNIKKKNVKKSTEKVKQIKKMLSEAQKLLVVLEQQLEALYKISTNEAFYFQDAQKLKSLVEVSYKELLQSQHELKAHFKGKKLIVLANTMLKAEMLTQEAKTLYEAIEEIKAHKREAINYLVFLRLHERLREKNQFINSLHLTFLEQNKQLEKAYSISLIDMKRESFLNVKAEVWKEGHAFSTRFISYKPKQVTFKVYDYFLKLDNKAFVTISPSFFGENNLDIAAKKDFLSVLELDYKKYMESYNGGLWWVSSRKQTFFHKYLKVYEDGTFEAEWKEVKLKTYNKHIKNLGMQIAYKGVGEYESEALETISPIGLGVVGNSAYGHWKIDEITQKRYWVYTNKYLAYTKYAPGEYSYKEYESFQNSKDEQRVYYGENNEYGTGGSKTFYSSLYLDTVFAIMRHEMVNYAKQGQGIKHVKNLRASESRTRARGPSGGGK